MNKRDSGYDDFIKAVRPVKVSEDEKYIRCTGDLMDKPVKLTFDKKTGNWFFDANSVIEALGTEESIKLFGVDVVLDCINMKKKEVSDAI